jgi:hypothetical protein
MTRENDMGECIRLDTETPLHNLLLLAPQMTVWLMAQGMTGGSVSSPEGAVQSNEERDKRAMTQWVIMTQK